MSARIASISTCIWPTRRSISSISPSVSLPSASASTTACARAPRRSCRRSVRTDGGTGGGGTRDVTFVGEVRAAETDARAGCRGKESREVVGEAGVNERIFRYADGVGVVSEGFPGIAHARADRQTSECACLEILREPEGGDVFGDSGEPVAAGGAAGCGLRNLRVEKGIGGDEVQIVDKLGASLEFDALCGGLADLIVAGWRRDHPEEMVLLDQLESGEGEQRV